MPTDMIKGRRQRPGEDVADTRWLERHGRKWRVTVAVPRDMQDILGTRLKKNLDTTDLAVANELKQKIVSDLHLDIKNARVNRDRQTHSAGLGSEHIEQQAYVAASGYIHEIVVSIEGVANAEFRLPVVVGNILRISVDHIGAESSAARHRAPLCAQPTSIMAHHNTYLSKILVNFRTKADDVRAMRYLSQWCEREGVSQTLQSIDRKTAVRFMDGLSALCGGLSARTQNKYLGRICRYWKFMVDRAYTDINPWLGLIVDVPATKYDEEERAFKDAEVRALLVGDAEPRLMDLMLIGALTGARLDAIVDLKVKDVADGAFTFKRQKKERTARDVPVHAALASIVVRRTTGRAGEDPFFPEWPAPTKRGSLRERSFKASNAFTHYRRACGVDETVAGKRRSLVNFHSFRRWFITKAERAGNDGDLIAALVGHKRMGMTLGRYSEGPDWEAAQRCVESVRLPALDDSSIVEARSLSPRRRAG